MHRASQCAVATNAIFRRSFLPPATRSKNARATGFNATTRHVASTRYFRTVAGPSRVMCPNRLTPALASWDGTKPKYAPIA